MTTKTQILVNIILTLSFAFTCYITLQSNRKTEEYLIFISSSQDDQQSKVDILNEYFHLFIERDIEYQIKRANVLSTLEKTIDDYKKAKEKLHTY